MHDDVHVRVDLGDTRLGGQRLRGADVGLAVDHLSLQVGLVDDVEVDDPECAHSGCREVHERRRAEPAGADDEHAGVLQPLLAGHADIRDDQVPRIAADLVDAQLCGRLDQGRQRHVISVAWFGSDVANGATEPGIPTARVHPVRRAVHSGRSSVSRLPVRC